MATITVSDLATELTTDARTARKFLRSITPADAQPGKGGRWIIEKREVRSLKSKFAKFEAAQVEARNAREVKSEDLTSEERLENLGYEEPTSEELDAMDDLIASGDIDF